MEKLRLFGREKIFTNLSAITLENVIAEINRVLKKHYNNMVEIDYLERYVKGDQPILERKKDVRPEICNKIVINNASMVVNFKNGYFLQKPASYVSRRADEDVIEKVRQLNDWNYLSGKHEADNSVINSFHTSGLGVLYVQPTDSDDVPYETYSVDPKTTFVVYSLRPGNKPMMGISLAIVDDTLHVDVYTKENVFRLKGMPISKATLDAGITSLDLVVNEITEVLPNTIGAIPIIEYTYNSNRVSAFESAIDIMDDINAMESNRADAVEQKVQSLMILYNCELKDGVTANQIRKAGYIELKNVGDNKADIKILNDELDQTQTQTTLDSLYEQMLDKCGVPSSIRDAGSSSDNVGAVYLRSGWAMADTNARNTEDEFIRSSKYYNEVILSILAKRFGFDIKASDFELKIVRNDTNNMLLKTQVALNLRELGFSPELTFERSSLSGDPVNDVKMSQKYIDMKWENNEEFEYSEVENPTIGF